MSTIIIWHDNCPDGATAAWVALKEHPRAISHPAQHGSEPPDCTGLQVIMLDFTYPHEHMMSIAEQCRQLLVLDHHQTGHANTANIVGTNIEIVIDESKSGARLAWERWPWPTQCDDGGWTVIIPDVVKYVEDRDLWKFQYGDATHEYSAALSAYPLTPETIELFHCRYTWMVLSDGEAIRRFREQMIETVTSGPSGWVEIGGHRVPAANVMYTIGSDVAGALALKHPEAPFACYFFDQPTESGWVRQWGLTVRGDSDFDVAVLAQRFGGGGHAKASGFRQQIDAPGCVASSRLG